jgi:hypothetical protein
MPHTPAPSPARVAARSAKKWKDLPKGWTEESVRKFWDSLTDRAPKHPVSRCIREMDGKVSNPGAFCGGLADQMIPGWREEAAKERAKKTGARNDPYWMTARYPGRDHNGKPFRKGDRVFYYPLTKTILTGPEAEAASRDFESHAFDEDFGMRAGADDGARFLAKKYSLTTAESKALAANPHLVDKIEDFREKNGLPHPGSALVREMIWKLIGFERAPGPKKACGDGPCQCGGQCGCKGGSPLSMQPDYGASDAALPRGASAARVAALYGGP